MAEFSIDRLTLQVPGYSEAEGRRLALAVTDGLAAAQTRGAGQVSTMRLDLAVGAETQPDRLARQIVSAILRELERLP